MGRRLASILLVLLAGAGLAIWFLFGEETAEHVRLAAGAPKEPEQAAATITEDAGRDAYRATDATALLQDGQSNRAVAGDGTGKQRELLSWEQEVVSDFNEKYLGALTFDSPEQKRWGSKNGYPSEEQVIAAAGMSTEQLRTRAEADDPAFEVLYFDRLLDDSLKQLDLITSGGTSREDYLATREGFERSSMLRRQSEEVLRTNSPFAGYLLFRYNDTFTKDKYSALAALYMVGVRGDRRAGRAVSAYAANSGFSQEAIELLGAYAAMEQMAESINRNRMPLH